jgi:hypothetical protein
LHGKCPSLRYFRQIEWVYYFFDRAYENGFLNGTVLEDQTLECFECLKEREDPGHHPV